MGAIFRKLFKIFRRFIQLLFSRMIVVALLIILQIIWIWLLFELLAEYNTIIQICTAVLGVILVLVVVNKDEVPEYKMPWLLVIVISPILGGVLFIFFGSNQPGRRMKREYMRLEREVGRVICQNEKTLAALEEKDAVAAAQAKYIYESSRSPVYDGTHTQYFPMGEDMFPAMVRELKKAEKFVFLEYFIIEEGRFLNTILEILQRKMQEGVEVRIMYDDIGSIGKVRMGYARKLRKMGFNAQVFRPFLPFISARLWSSTTASPSRAALTLPTNTSTKNFVSVHGKIRASWSKATASPNLPVCSLRFGIYRPDSSAIIPNTPNITPFRRKTLINPTPKRREPRRRKQ